MVTKFAEQCGVAFDCEGETLIGVITRPEQPMSCGVLVVVGGPQYRAGSHRQFVLLARHLAEHSIACMRFDYRGMGDSSGALRNFEHVDADIRAALDSFFAAVPELQEVALWGLCDGASASIFYAYRDERVRGLVLLNPWVRTVMGEAKVYLKHYYLKRAVDPAFWKKALTGRFDLKASLSSLAENIKRAAVGHGGGASLADPMKSNTLPDRMGRALHRFDGRVLLVLSGNDLTAKEFVDSTATSACWPELLEDSRVSRIDVPEANHTFSTREWRDLVSVSTQEWLASA